MVSSPNNELFTLPLNFQLPNEPEMNLLEGLAQVVGDVDHHSLPVADNIHMTANVEPSPPHMSTIQQG